SNSAGGVARAFGAQQSRADSARGVAGPHRGGLTSPLLGGVPRSLGRTSPDAELVPLRIGEHHPTGPVAPAPIVQHPRAQAGRSPNLLITPGRGRPQIKMDPVLGRLSFWDPKEQQSRLTGNWD